jgi:hypothetical protein|tara:strand:- start:678 stop:1001 length:324 start_codon:yes stop_codon:yes gene_type:complete
MPDYKAKEVSKGNLWTNDGRTGKQPHFRGNLVITRAQAKHIMSHMKAGASELKITVAAWQNQNDDGSAWFGLSAETLPSDDAPVAAAPPPPPPPPVADNDFEDDIPF